MIKKEIISLEKEMLPQLSKYNITELKAIDTSHIVIGEWVLLKCKFGCDSYGKNWCCTPATFPVEQFRRMLAEYSAAFLVIGKGLGIPQQNNFIEGLTELERLLFLKNYYKAFVLTNGPCNRCKKCTYPKLPCKYPALARPAAESLGVDIFATVRSAGKTIGVLDSKQEFSCYGIALIE